MLRLRLPRPLLILLGILAAGFGLALSMAYLGLREWRRSTLAAAMETARPGSVGQSTSKPLAASTVVLPDCGDDQAFSAFPTREISMKTVHIFECKHVTYVLLPTSSPVQP